MSENENTRRRLPKASTLIAVVALFAALGGSAFAAKDLITGKEIKKGTVTSKNVKDKTLKTKDLNPKTISALKGQKGEKGEQGPQGPAGVVDPVQGIDLQQNIAANATETLVTLNVPAGRYLVSAKSTLFTNGTDQVGCSVEANDDSLSESRLNWQPAAASLDMTLSGTVLVPAGTTKIELDCGMAGQNGSARDSVLVAVPVA